MDDTRVLGGLIEQAAVEARPDWDGQIRLSQAISLKRIADLAEAWGAGFFNYSPPSTSIPKRERPDDPPASAETIARYKELRICHISNGKCTTCEKPSAECDCLPF